MQNSLGSLEGRARVVIEGVQPEVDCGRRAAKRIVGDRVRVTAVVYGDGHDHVAARLLYRRSGTSEWRSVPMQDETNDLWAGYFQVDAIGEWEYTVEAWVDHFDTWVHDLHKRIEAQDIVSATGAATAAAESIAPALPEQNSGEKPLDERVVAMQDSPGANTGVPAVGDVPLAFRSGALLLQDAAKRASGTDAAALNRASEKLLSLARESRPRYDFPLDENTITLALHYPDRRFAARYDRVLPLWVDRERAGFSAWYEFFPRSAGDAGKHGTLRDAARQLPRVAAMGFDIVYFPPIHPIGTAYRKGKNNSITAEAGDVGSPWAIGNTDGGHTAILKELGTFEDFDFLMKSAAENGLEVALDIAFQCAPDHPWVKEHPEWFRTRPDGSIQYAENPPKKYQDIYPINFESDDWQSLWHELNGVFRFWVQRGVRVFRVDNPHTKALPFWNWCIAEVRKTDPDVLFLAEAFTRPHVMYGLAKAGYSQSYTYFTWRTTRAELVEYCTEIMSVPVSDFFRPNFWPNTPDINPSMLQTGSPAAFTQRAILAATLSSNWGVYGPAYELLEHEPLKPGGEEYRNSEKYEIRSWNQDDPKSLAPLFTRLNRIRREHPALQRNDGLRFHSTNNDQILCFSKRRGNDVILVLVNLDPQWTQAGWTDLDMFALGLPWTTEFEAEDLLSGAVFRWKGQWNYVSLDPGKMPAHILHLRSAHLSENTAGESTED